MSEFGGSKSGGAYTLPEKLRLFQSLCKWPQEEARSYLVRVKCVAAVLAGSHRVPADPSDLPGDENVLVRVLFLFGLDEIEQNLVVGEAEAKSLQDMCRILSMPEVKIIKKADVQSDIEEEVPLKAKRKRKRATPITNLKAQFSF